MGGALIVEGILSACYHICPTRVNFQFGMFPLSDQFQHFPFVWPSSKLGKSRIEFAYIQYVGIYYSNAMSYVFGYLVWDCSHRDLLCVNGFVIELLYFQIRHLCTWLLFSVHWSSTTHDMQTSMLNRIRYSTKYNATHSELAVYYHSCSFSAVLLMSKFDIET